MRNVCGKHQASFDVYAPDGAFYTRLAAPFVAGGDGSRQLDDGYAIELALPVAGTDIAKGSLVGTWSVNFMIDNDPLALGVGLFELYR